jgi:hypothetical protein
LPCAQVFFDCTVGYRSLLKNVITREAGQ